MPVPVVCREVRYASSETNRLLMENTCAESKFGVELAFPAWHVGEIVLQWLAWNMEIHLCVCAVPPCQVRKRKDESSRSSRERSRGMQPFIEQPPARQALAMRISMRFGPSQEGDGEAEDS